ncbi:MAG: aldose 1-epimerase [Solirubrobacterales bacterium]|nr:aldose 1-epimerase [Solirubrobacterales bacterium]
MTAHRIEIGRTSGFRAWSLHDEEADLHATWIPGAGMLGASLVHRGDELLWIGDDVPGYAGERKFMGIPFLHPWANRLDGFVYRAGGREVVLDRASPLLKLDEHGLPIHGVLTASRRWSVKEAAADDHSARLTAGLEFERPELLSAFPFRHRVEIEVRVAEGALQVRTTLTATGQSSVPVSFGFHPYLRIPGVPRSRWEVSFPVHRRMQLDERQIPTGASEEVSPLTGPIGDRTWDDGYDRIDTLKPFELHAGGREIAMHYSDGYPIAQIFAPPGEEYLCIEPMTARANSLAGPDDALAWVAPGNSHTATFQIACHSER